MIRNCFIIFSVAFLSGCTHKVFDLKVVDAYQTSYLEASAINNRISWGRPDEVGYFVVRISSQSDLFAIAAKNGIYFDVDAYQCNDKEITFGNFDLSSSGRAFDHTKQKELVVNSGECFYDILFNGSYGKRDGKGDYHRIQSIIDPKKSGIESICFFAEARGYYGDQTKYTTNVLRLDLKNIRGLTSTEKQIQNQ